MGTNLIIGGVVLPTVCNGFANKELFSNNSNSLPGFKINKYRCRFCQITISSFSEMQNHLLQFHGNRLFECEVCEERTESQTQLLEHLEQHLLSGEKPFSCNLCSRRYALPRQLKEHLRHHLSKTIPCYHCSKRFKTENSLQEHMNTHTGYRPYECEQCHKRFSSKYVLKTHMRTHGTRNRPHKCKVCQKHFLTANHLSDHLQIHQNRKDFICENCGKAFGTQRSLDLHSITHSGVKNFVCRICFKAFARKGEVEDHERIHTGEKPFQCEICGATFSQRSNLQSHKRATHYEEKKYQCTECNKAFKRRRLLVYHVMSVHTGERPYKCSYCNAAFVYPEHYKKHLRIHTGEKPFKCEICGKAFNSRDNKNAHKFIHSEKKQYECTLCGVGFMRKPQLMGHIQQHERTENIEAYIKVNSSSVVDAEISESRAMQSPTLALKIDEEQSIDNNLDHIQLVRNSVEVEAVDISRQIQLSDDVPHYVIHKAGDKSDESVDHFLASLRGQVVEVRAEDLERYTELTADQISQMAQVAAQVVVTQGNAGTGTQLSQDTPDFRLFQIQLDDDTKGPHRQTDTAILSTGSPLVVAQSKIATNTTTLSSKQNFTFKKNSSQTINNSSSNNSLEDSNCSTSIRQNRNWVRSSTDFVDNS
ncbi:Zinc finger protein [Armadillidium vulgare]|nr:Zinc finger protein [Armadillidium vulgare]